MYIQGRACFVDAVGFPASHEHLGLRALLTGMTVISWVQSLNIWPYGHRYRSLICWVISCLILPAMCTSHLPGLALTSHCHHSFVLPLIPALMLITPAASCLFPRQFGMKVLPSPVTDIILHVASAPLCSILPFWSLGIVFISSSCFFEFNKIPSCFAITPAPVSFIPSDMTYPPKKESLWNLNS